MGILKNLKTETYTYKRNVKRSYYKDDNNWNYKNMDFIWGNLSTYKSEQTTVKQ